MKLTKEQSVTYNHLLEEQHLTRRLLEYSRERRAELKQRKAPAWMLERYDQDIEAFELHMAQLECEIGDLADMKYR